MLSLRLAVASERAGDLADALEATGGIRRLSRTTAQIASERSSAGRSRAEVVLVADVLAEAADTTIAVIEDFGIDADAYVLSRLEVVAPSAGSRDQASAGASFAWVEVLGAARSNSRPLARYLALIVSAGIIAALGVIKGNSILIVGAMAVSPDLLPICAACVGIVGGRWRLVRRALLTLLLGLVLVTVVATALAALLKLFGVLPNDYRIGEGGLATLAHTDYSTVLVALAAGVAGMLSFETRASAAVGVAISVTTIPASAYLGVAIGLGQQGTSALVVLLVNVVLLVLSGSATLALQRELAARRSRR